jgi:hypothetical protein
MSFPEIQIGDNLLDDAIFSSVEVTQDLNQHWRCTIVYRQLRDELIPVEDFIGKPIEIKTIDGQGVERIHFSGFVHNVGLNYEFQGNYTVNLQAISSSYVMDLALHKQHYAGQTLSSIADTMANRAGLEICVKADGRKALDSVQSSETDFFFLNRLVGNHGCWLRPKAGGIEVFDCFQSGSTLEWHGEDGFTDFSIQGELASTSFNGLHPEFYNSVERLTGAVQSASKMLQAGGCTVGGSVTGNGHSRSLELKAGNTVQIDGDFSAQGTYGLIKVNHHWDRNGYGNTFICTPWKNYCNPQPETDESVDNAILQKA